MPITVPVPTNVPPEIVYEILTYQFRDYMSNDQPSTSEKFNENLRNFLRSNLTVNKTFYHICRILIYKYCNLTTAKRFHSLLNATSEVKELRNIIQVADFQELTSIGLGRTGEMNKQIKNLTKDTLLKFLRLTKCNLREFLASEHIQDDLDDKIIHFLLKPGKVLSVLDFCGCSGPNFTKSFILALRKLYLQSSSNTDSTNNLNDDDNISIASFSTLNSVEICEIEGNDFQFTPDDMNMSMTPIESNYQITCLGLNDCTDLPNFVLGRLLKTLPDLQKLDLSRTSIDDTVLINIVPHLKNLSHLSLANCSQLTPRAILEFFSHHPAVTDENNEATLEWLNLSVISHSSSWTVVHTMFLLKKLCQFGHNKTLQYLNIGGLPLHLVTEPIRPLLTRTNSSSMTSLNETNDNSIYSTVIQTSHFYQCSDALLFIKLNFPNLKSLSIRGNNVPISRIIEFLSPMDPVDASRDIFKDMTKHQQLKFLNISNNSYINKWSIQDPSIIASSTSLVALEISFDAWHQIEKSNAQSELTYVKYNKDTNKNDVFKWKCYIDSSYGRRYWIYKTDKYLNREDTNSTESNLTQFDIHGNKIIKIFKQPDFLKFAQSKISLSCGLVTKSSYRRKHCYRDIKPPISQFLTRNGGITFGNTISPIVGPVLPPGGWRILPDEDSNGESDSEYNSNIIENDITLTNNTEESINATDTNITINSNENDINNDHMHHQLGNALYWDRSIHDLQAYGQRQVQEGQLLDQNQLDLLVPSQIIQPPRIPQMRPPITPLGRIQRLSFQNSMEQVQTDEEYLNNPELQRRRSQLQLGFLRSHSHTTSSRSNSRIRTLNNHRASNSPSPSSNFANRKHTARIRTPLNHSDQRKTKEYYLTHPNEFVYDPTDPVTSERYRLHFEQVNEYRTFGCIERGMYRYYSLKM